jgi:hypothetical protein
MRKTNEADLCHALESDVTSISQLTPFDRSSTVLIQDGMALLQSMNVKGRACLLAFTPRNFFQSGIGRPSIN